jgi:hypothetical protein
MVNISIKCVSEKKVLYIQNSDTILSLSFIEQSQCVLGEMSLDGSLDRLKKRKEKQWQL